MRPWAALYYAAAPVAREAGTWYDEIMIDNPMMELRQKLLALKPEELGLGPKDFPHEVWGILMETGFPEGSFTLVGLADGTASLYFSTGGGIIGAGGHESVENALGDFLSAANHYISEAKPAKATPLPEDGQVNFYFLTQKGVYTYSAPEEMLGEEKDKLTPLFFAGHNVIFEMRAIEEGKEE
jgi:hypothetical protein